MVGIGRETDAETRSEVESTPFGSLVHALEHNEVGTSVDNVEASQDCRFAPPVVREGASAVEGAEPQPPHLLGPPIRIGRNLRSYTVFRRKLLQCVDS